MSRFFPYFFLLVLSVPLFFHHLHGVFLGGDDVYLVFSSRAQFWDQLFDREFSYLRAVQGRDFLVFFYRQVYFLFGESAEWSLSFFCSFIFFASALVYRLLKKLVSARCALLGAAFYLTYIGRYGVTAKLQGGFYAVVAFALVLSLTILFSQKIGLRFKYLFIALIFWATFHIYEVLIVLVPFFVLHYLWMCRSGRAEFKCATLLLSLLPTLVAGLHVGILSMAQNPIWNRGVENPETSMGMIFKSIKVLKLGWSTTFGAAYWDTLFAFLKYFVLHLSSHWNVILWVVGALCCLAYLFWTKAFSQVVSELASRKTLWTCLLVCLALALLCPVVSVTTITDFVPSRFSFTASVFLSIAIVCLMQIFEGKRWNRGVLEVSTWALVLAQAMATAGQTYQATKAADFDRRVEESIVAILGKIEEGDRFVLRFPSNVDHVGASPLAWETPVYLGNDANTLLWGRFPYLREVPQTFGYVEGSHRERAFFHEKLKAWAEFSPKTYFFYFNHELKAFEYVERVEHQDSSDVYGPFKLPPKVELGGENIVTREIPKAQPERFKFYVRPVLGL